ncbi:ABC transporter ATP-binding protein [Cryobacterium sp. BB307]|uniref:ATP-binding cassette domain-containing protein n=1 Tax=Cryobacterium sp. BB307 TaxID=2716317 RepID=UPI001447E2A4
MIEARNLTKTYGDKTVVDDITFTIQPGRVTGFLGPNGAGKSTTMRMILGLDTPTSGSVTVDGRHYGQHRAPLQEVGALLDARAFHPSRSARNHLLAMATTHGISARRVDEVLQLTGLAEVAGRRAGNFSLGMGQRLGIAGALLGDPKSVILDEPVNGLDPDGVLWVRHLARTLADEGRTVFLSSHLMSEMAQTADHLIVIGRGRIIADAPIADILAGGGHRTLVRVEQQELLQAAVVAMGATVQTGDDDELLVAGLEPREIAGAALDRGLLIYELTPQRASLEEAYMELTRDDVEYQSLALTGKGN